MNANVFPPKTEVMFGLFKVVRLVVIVSTIVKAETLTDCSPVLFRASEK